MNIDNICLSDDQLQRAPVGFSPSPALNAAVCIVSPRDGCSDCGHVREVALMDVAPEGAGGRSSSRAATRLRARLPGCACALSSPQPAECALPLNSRR